MDKAGRSVVPFFFRVLPGGAMMTQVPFIILAAIAAAVFLWRMKVDPLAVAFGASVIYFMPGFFGVAQFSYGQHLESYSDPIVPAAYAAMALVFVALVAVALAVDRIRVGPRISLGFEARIPLILLIFAIVAGAISIRNVGVYYLCLDKTIILERIDVWYYYASFSVPFCIATAYRLRQWPIGAVGVLCMLADLYAGFRLVTAITFISCAMLAEDSLRRGWRNVVAFVAILAMGGAALFVVKHLIVPAKYGTASYCDAQIALDAKIARDARNPLSAGPVERGREKESLSDQPRTMSENLSATAVNLSHVRFYYSAFVMQSEAFVIQSILNEVVRQDFHTDAGYLVGQILTGLPLGASLFGIDSSKVVSFNSMMQPALFPRVGFGMANNPWAQAYAAGGEWMVAVFAFGYACSLGILSLLFRGSNGALKAIFAVVGAWLGFYFHRNDLFVEAILIKHVLYVCGASILAAWVWDWMVPWPKAAQQSIKMD